MSATEAVQRLQYPSTHRGDVVEKYGDVVVADPYRWLEEQDSEETQAWVKQQQAVTQPFIESLESATEIEEELKSVYNFEKFSTPFKRGRHFYYFYNSGLQNQSVLYRQESVTAPHEEAELVLDPNTWSEDGTTALGSAKFTEDGTLMAYLVQERGSDWRTGYVRNMETGEVLEDKLEWLKFSGLAWTADNKGIFYARFDKPEGVDSDKKGTEGDTNLNQKLCYHRLGTSQEEDEIFYCNPDEPQWMYSFDTSDDGRYLVVTVSKSCDPERMVLLFDLEKKGSDPKALVDEFKEQYFFIANVGDLYYFQTKTEVVRVNISTGEWSTVLAKTENVLDDVTCANEKYLIASYIEDVKNVVKVFDMEGNFLNDIDLPSFGTVTVSGRKKVDLLFYKFTSFTYPGTIFSYDFESRTSSVFRQIKVGGVEPDAFEAEQVFYTSKDGTKVPMFIVAPKGLERNGSNPTYLYGYGGFDISLMPSFNPFRCAFMKGFNAIVAVANLRGGGEYGKAWHQAGQKEKKQNVFDDFIAAAEYLCDKQYTRPDKLAITGGSNGGLLVAACLVQRPDLFGAVVCDVGVLDMLRFHKFTIGHYWTSDYGCADDPEQFPFLYAYSPLHNVKKGVPYPATLLCTADHDDRVVPGHSFKFISELQHQLGAEPYQTAPLLIRIESNAGHGSGKPTAMVIKEGADKYAFMGFALKATWNN